MVYSFLLHYLLLIYPLMPGIKSTEFKLPEVWSKDFTITVSHGGGMLNERLDISITYDSCKFMHSVQEELKENSFLMTIESRAAVLKKLHELKVTKIEPDFSNRLTYDKATSSIVFKYKGQSFFIQDSASSNIKKTYKENFNQAFNYLQLFAMEKH